MPYTIDKIAINNELLDRRVKLTKAQKDEIRAKYFRAKNAILHNELHPHVSQRTLAKEYSVSRRTIQYVLDPEKIKQQKENLKKRGGVKIYYKKESHKEYIKTHRKYKNQLYNQGLI